MKSTLTASAWSPRHTGVRDALGSLLYLMVILGGFL